MPICPKCGHHFLQRPVLDKALRAAVRSRANYRCEVCNKGRDEAGPLEIHHVDGDPWNNDIRNLLYVCRPCHRFAHRAMRERIKADKDRASQERLRQARETPLPLPKPTPLTIFKEFQRRR
jgi:uncharacterized Fe-S cluster-containing radical SAM superfamily protein